MSTMINIQLTEEEFKRLGTLVELGEVVIGSKNIDEHPDFQELRTSDYEGVIGDLITCGEESEIEWAEQEELASMKKILLEALHYHQASQYTSHYKQWKKQRDELATKKFYNRFNNIPSPEIFTRQVSDEEMENWLNQEEI